MEVHNVPDQGLANSYLIQGVESNPQSIDQFEQFGSMYNEGAPDYVVDQGVYFPTATSYGYICSGYEPTTDWEDQHKFSPDSQDIHYAVTANENMPYVYYSPNYGYAQSPYNPYNPYIPGAVIGADGSIISPTQYYSLPSYENPVTSTAYLPVVFQQMPDAIANGIVDPRIDTAGSAVKVDGLHNLALNTPNSSLIAIGDSSSQRAFAKMSEGGRDNIGTGKQHLLTSQIPQIRVPKGVENGVRGKASVVSSQLKAGFTSGNGSSASESGIYAQASVNRVKSNMLSGRGLDDERVDPNTLNDQNRESRMSKSKNHLVVKAYTTRAGNPDVQGNIIISRDQYNRVDFPVEYANAKFFVIKSYSEDDVHKSIKYNVWSSTPNGNKKLNAAYEDAKRISGGDSRGCPIFLLFSVNASGQFCGVAEMTGPVDFHRDMDFWQQDKWSGSFPVKWHIIKDLPNPNFRHIILENNENKPVTNSRDTQEISYKKGLDMLKIFKSYASKTSLLDDFMYYENRQRILQGERTRLYIKSYENPYLVPLLDPPRKFQSVHDFPPICDVNGAKHNVNNLTIVNNSEVFSSAVSTCAMRDHAEPKGKFPLDTDSNNSASDRGSCQVLADGVAEPKGKFPSDTYSNNSASFPGSCPVLADGVSNAVDELKISELNIHSDEQGSGRTVPTSAVSNKANSEMANVVTIGSMPVKVKDSESCGFLTVGTIPLDPRTLLHE